MLAHSGSVTGFDFTRDGRYIVTTGSDNQMKVFDIRQSFTELYSYWTPRKANGVSISQSGLVASICGPDVLIWKDLYTEKQKKPYLKHNTRTNNIINRFNFVPYEDFAGITYNKGFESIMIPGSCIADYDTYEHNIAGVRKQDRETQVHKLLDKLAPDTINWDPYMLGKIDPTSKEIKEKEKRQQEMELMTKKYQNAKKKQKKGLKGNTRKDIFRDKLRREEVKKNTLLRKELYRAEKEKMDEELMKLNENVEDIVNVTSGYLNSLKKDE